MECGSGLRHVSIAASPRPSPRAVSARSGDDPRLRLRGHPQPSSAGVWPKSVDPSTQPLFSPFVPTLDDSESAHADPSGTSLALSDRLAGDQQDCSFHAGRWTLRTLPASPWTSCRAARRQRWGLVGCGARPLARRPRSAAASGTGVRSARRHPYDAQARLSCHRAPQSRSDLQRAAMAQSRRVLPTLPHDPRRAGASPPSMVECLSSSRVGRSFHRQIQLAAIRACKASLGAPERFVLSDINSKPRPPDLQLGKMPNRPSRGRAPAIEMGSRFSPPAPLQRGGCRWAVRRCSGGQNDRSLSDPQDDRDGATTAGR